MNTGNFLLYLWSHLQPPEWSSHPDRKRYIYFQVSGDHKHRQKVNHHPKKRWVDQQLRFVRHPAHSLTYQSTRATWTPRAIHCSGSHPHSNPSHLTITEYQHWEPVYFPRCKELEPHFQLMHGYKFECRRWSHGHSRGQ